ncbi:MAG: PrkA family serine protein kinase [Alphaproteobacteria bacterium]|nr:PrkA family serine protein kinase [Alphaproteobacteria bacterium]
MSSNAADLGIFENLAEDYGNRKAEEKEVSLSLNEYLELCKTDKSAYASAAQRLLKAIGEPKIVDTSMDPQLRQVFSNRKIPVYDAFKDFYGMEDTISQVMAFLRSAAQGLEEGKQVLYLLGPVGSAKSSLAERLKDLMEEEPFYTLAVEVEGPNGEKVMEYSPVNENVFGLFSALPKRKDGKTWAEVVEATYKVPQRQMKHFASPWLVQKLEEFGNDITKFKVVQRYPNRLKQIAISKTEPGDENNQDISALVGKVDIRKLEDFPQNDPRSYSFSGGLCTGNRGLMEFVEMFKAPIKVLHPLLTATQEGNFNGTEAIGAIPFDGIILAHSNESEWDKFRNNKENEAFIARTQIIRVPYTLRVSQELEIYKKLIRLSELADAPCAPGTFEMAAEFAVLSRLVEPENSDVVAKMKVYDGQNIKDKNPKAKPIEEYRKAAEGKNEGMWGVDTRFMFKTLSQTFNFTAQEGGEIAADPIHLMYVLEDRIRKEQLPKEKTDKYIGFIDTHMRPKYREFIGKEIMTAYVESFGEFGQNVFDRYIKYAENWLESNDYRDPETGKLFSRDALEKELEKIEKPAGVVNSKDFRNEVVRFVLNARAKNNGQNPDWRSYEKLKDVIEKSVTKNAEEMLPVISYGPKGDAEAQKKHESFVERMMKKHYTPMQVRRAVEFYLDK